MNLDQRLNHLPTLRSPPGSFRSCAMSTEKRSQEVHDHHLLMPLAFGRIQPERLEPRSSPAGPRTDVRPARDGASPIGQEPETSTGTGPQDRAQEEQRRTGCPTSQGGLGSQSKSHPCRSARRRERPTLLHLPLAEGGMGKPDLIQARGIERQPAVEVLALK